MGTDGGDNVDMDPQFWNVAEDNLRLLPDSPAIDAGNNASLPPGVTTDLDGLSRIFDGTVDMGAYESRYTGPAEPHLRRPECGRRRSRRELDRRPHRPELRPALGDGRRPPRRLDHRRSAGGGR